MLGQRGCELVCAKKRDKRRQAGSCSGSRLGLTDYGNEQAEGLHPHIPCVIVDAQEDRQILHSIGQMEALSANEMIAQICQPACCVCLRLLTRQAMSQYGLYLEVMDRDVCCTGVWVGASRGTRAPMPPTAATAAAILSLPAVERAARAPIAVVRTDCSVQERRETISRTPPQLMSTMPLLSAMTRLGFRSIQESGSGERAGSYHGWRVW